MNTYIDTTAAIFLLRVIVDRRNLLVAHKFLREDNVRPRALVSIDIKLQAILEEPGIDTDVYIGESFPLQVRVAQFGH